MSNVDRRTPSTDCALRRAALLTGVLLATGCGDTATPPGDDDPGIDYASWPQSASVLPALPPVCAEPTPAPLVAESGQQLGTVELTHDATKLYVTFRSDANRPITASAVLAAGSADEVPTSTDGEPVLPSFALRSSHPGGPSEVIWEIPRSVATGPEAVVAAFALVGQLPAWGDGDPIAAGHWATFMLHTLTDCAVERVGPEGGSAISTSGLASVMIPAGALTNTLEIELLPASLAELAEHVPASEWDATLGTVYGVTPIDGTIWDLGPDGTVFDQPATIELHYDDAQLPPGIDEELLGVHVINAIFDPRPSVVDTESNTVTAEIGHFSFAFLALPPEIEGATVDLKAGQPAIAPGSDVRVEGVIGLTSRVDNLGDETSNPATLLFEIAGDVEVGIIAPACATVPPGDGITVAVACGVGALEPLDSEIAGPVWVTPLSEGDVEIVATAVAAPQDTDTNPENDTFLRTIPVATTYLVDLEPVATPRITGIREPGETLTYEVRVGNYLPPSNGGSIVYEATGPVALGDVTEGCTAAAAPAVSVTCPFDAFLGFVNDTRGPNNELIPGYVGPFEVVTLGDGLVTFSATTVPIAGDTDLVPENDRAETTLPIGARTVDLEVVSFDAPTTATVDVSFDATVTVRSLGPDESRGTAMTVSVFGSADFTDLADGCRLTSGGLRCEIGVPTIGETITIPLRVTPRATGILALTASYGSTWSQDVDPERSNNSADVAWTVQPGG